MASYNHPHPLENCWNLPQWNLATPLDLWTIDDLDEEPPSSFLWRIRLLMGFVALVLGAHCLSALYEPPGASCFRRSPHKNRASSMATHTSSTPYYTTAASSSSSMRTTRSRHYYYNNDDDEYYQEGEEREHDNEDDDNESLGSLDDESWDDEDAAVGQVERIATE
uniref:Uncharacterized protein n=1 Tax=Entomoneis paludosa TaxID=265537 RepID=A0A6U3BV44_9STRA|mmetsp:Transcript_33395/g.69543  ORF Transcript_33395/g.69543 Transcript_33395/m.69543 type:complete len:166 (+) Transcript_33395:154-651(+)